MVFQPCERAPFCNPACAQTLIDGVFTCVLPSPLSLRFLNRFLHSHTGFTRAVASFRAVLRHLQRALPASAAKAPYRARSPVLPGGRNLRCASWRASACLYRAATSHIAYTVRRRAPSRLVHPVTETPDARYACCTQQPAQRSGAWSSRAAWPTSAPSWSAWRRAIHGITDAGVPISKTASATKRCILIAAFWPEQASTSPRQGTMSG